MSKNFFSPLSLINYSEIVSIKNYVIGGDYKEVSILFYCLK